MSALDNSGHTSPTPAPFPSFVLFNATLTSCNHHLLGLISSISSFSTTSSSSTGFVGSSLFNISLKCSTHRCTLSRVSVLGTLSLSLTPTSCFRLSPVMDLVMLYSPLFLTFSAAFYTSAAILSNYFSLILPSTLLYFVVLRITLLSLSLVESFHSCTLHFHFFLFPLHDLFPCFVSYPWLTTFLWPPQNVLYCISLCCQNHIVIFLGILYVS